MLLLNRDVLLPISSLKRWLKSILMNELNKEILTLINKLAIIEDDAELTTFLKKITNPSSATIISFLNAHAFNLACENDDFRAALLRSDYLVRDGVGMYFCLRFMGVNPGINLNGTDLIPKILKCFVNKRVSLCGIQMPYIEKAANAMRGWGCNVVAYFDGFQPEEVYIKKLAQVKPDIIVLGVGIPEQERLSIVLRDTLKQPCLIINGGAVLNFLSMRIPRAPLCFRKVGLEWFFRLLVEPRRLWKRYLVGNFIFMVRILNLCLRSFITKYGKKI